MNKESHRITAPMLALAVLAALLVPVAAPAEEPASLKTAEGPLSRQIGHDMVLPSLPEFPAREPDKTPRMQLKPRASLFAQSSQAGPAGLEAAASVPVADPALSWRLGLIADILLVPPVLPVELPATLKGGEIQRELLTLDAAVNFGADFNLDAKIAAAQEEGQQSSARAAWAQLRPKIDVRVAGGRGEYQSISGPTPAMPRADQSVSLRQPLFDWSTYYEALKQDESSRAASLTRANAQSQAALDAGGAYLSVLQSTLVVRYTADYEQLLRKLLRYMEDRAGAGGASPADLERVRARVENANASVSENRAGLVNTLSQFARLTGRLPALIEVPAIALVSVPQDEQSAIAGALERNLDLRAARSLAEAVLLERRGADGRFMPRLDLELVIAENRNPSGSRGLQVDKRMMVILSWNVLNGGADSAQREVLNARRREFQLKVDNAERRLRQQLENAYSVLDSIRLRFDAVRAEVQSNRRVVDAFTEQLFATNRQLLDVLDAYQRFYQSRVDLTNLVVTEAQLRLQVAHLLGRLRKPILPEGK